MTICCSISLNKRWNHEASNLLLMRWLSGLKVLRRTTDSYRVALFKHIQPRKSGYILISALRLGYEQDTRKVRVR